VHRTRYCCGVILVALVLAALAPRATLAYNPTAAASYADQWAATSNPSYPVFTGDDCTNFVSQALHAGGISMVSSYVGGDRSTLKNWFVSGTSTDNASFSWSIAFDQLQWLYWQTYGGLARIYGPTQGSGSRSGVSVGDVLYFDWDDSNRYGVSHSVIQVGYGTDPNGWVGDLVDQHSVSRKHAFWNLGDYNANNQATTMITRIHIDPNTP